MLGRGLDASLSVVSSASDNILSPGIAPCSVPDGDRSRDDDGGDDDDEQEEFHLVPSLFSRGVNSHGASRRATGGISLSLVCRKRP